MIRDFIGYFFRISRNKASTGFYDTALKWLCYRKWLMFFLKFQMDKRKNALAVDPAKGKNRRKRLYFQGTVEMKQPQTITEPLK